MVETKARMEVRRRGADKEGAISRKESGLSCHLEREKRDRAKEAYRLYPLHKEEVQEEGKERLGGYGESLLPQSLFSSLSLLFHFPFLYCSYCCTSSASSFLLPSSFFFSFCLEFLKREGGKQKIRPGRRRVRHVAGAATWPGTVHVGADVDGQEGVPLHSRVHVSPRPPLVSLALLITTHSQFI